MGALEREAHNGAVLIFPTNVAADEWKWRRLNFLGTPIARNNSEHTVHDCSTVTADRSRGLQTHISLAVGAHIFINNNA